MIKDLFDYWITIPRDIFLWFLHRNSNTNSAKLVNQIEPENLVKNNIYHMQFMESLRKFNLDSISTDIDYLAIKNYSYLQYKFLITTSELELENFFKISSIDDIELGKIKESLFFLYFETDDQYIYHLDKIINNNGKFIIHKKFNKHNYVHSNKNCRLALINTINCINRISHYNEVIHGNICQALEQTKHLNGDYVEIGVYKGGSALTALNYIKYANINRKAYFLDTFDGFDYNKANTSSETHWEKNNDHHKLWGINNTINKTS